MGALTVAEYWRFLEQLDDLQKRESGEDKKMKLLDDPRYEAK